ncbi:MAG: AzlD domain-containing protein [Lachnospiraceae bacterium]|nr:AzlD domain-containing protein [Lachnospiraceae bacterium]
MDRILISIAIMAIVTYLVRVAPLTLFRKQIKSRYIRSFLDYTPFAVLGVMTFPDIFTSTGSVYSALAGTIVALILGYMRKGIVTVSCAAIVVVYLVERML